MRERLFIGWNQPVLPAVVEVLQQRCRQNGLWDLTSLLLVVPGGKAGRRLRKLIEDAAQAEGATLIGLTDPVTPADLLERLHTPTIPTASGMQARFAWRQAARRLHPSDTEQHLVGLATDGQRLHETLAAEGLTIADVAETDDDPRGKTLAKLEKIYRAVLGEARLGDRDDARMLALALGGVASDQTIMLVGLQDLNGQERAMLSALSSPICAVIPAPESEAAGFDELGSLRVEYWHDLPLLMDDTCLHFVEGPAEETRALVTQIAALNDTQTPAEITVGVGDTSGAEALARRLTLSGLSIASPFGRPLGRLAPGALLSLVHDYLTDNASARSFAALVRHPDLELRLAERIPLLSSYREGWPEPMQKMANAPLIHCLDHYRAECLVEQLPPLETSVPTNVLEVARGRVLAARDHVEMLLAPLRGASRPLSHWAGPMAGLLRSVLGDTSPPDDTADGRRHHRSVAGLMEILQDIGQLPESLAPEMTGADALAFVCAEAEATRLPSDPDGPATAMLGWLELALDDAPVLLLTGLHEGSIPTGTSDDALLPDSVRRKWGLSDDRRRQARDAWLLRVMLESRRHLQIIVTRRDADGTPKMPSRLLFACDGLTAAKRAARFTNSADASTLSQPLFAAGGARRLPPPRPVPPAAEINTLKVTAFRDYLACPYRFYLRHVTGLDEISDFAEEMDPRTFGNLLHPCLEAFARSPLADSTDPGRIAAFLHGALERECERQFGVQMPSAVRYQIRQAGRRLDAFALWQAQSARDGWQIQNDLAEREMEAALEVDGRPFVIKGRLDRVDYHPATDKFRIIDYKTGDSGAAPEDKHRVASEDGSGRTWTDLQLPLYRTLLAAQGFPEDSIEVGFVLLASDLNPVSVSQQGKTSGGVGFAAVRWTEADFHNAHECAADVVRRLRAGVFWPPSAPPRFTDAFSGLCLDACGDRTNWFAANGDAGL